MAGPPYPYSFDDPHRLDPDPLYAPLRRDEPVARVRVPYGRESWLVTRYGTVRAVLGDPRFSRAAAVGPDTPRSTPVWPTSDTMVSLDPPEHTLLRRLVAPAFTVRRIERLRPRAEAVVAGLLDGLAGYSPPADLVAQFAFPLPITMICELLGVPYADRARFGEWSHAILSRSAYPVEQVELAYQELYGYLSGLIARRRAEPAGDLLSTLVQAHDEGRRLTEPKLLSLATTLLVTGHETTASQIANFVYTLLTHPDQLAWLRADLSRVPAAVEELLRFVPLAAGAPSAQGHARVAMVDVPLDGVTIRAGEAVLPAVASANRDGAVFPHPDTLDLARVDNPHLAFGYGAHHCLGAQLARMELRTALTGLLRRFPELRLAVPPEQIRWRTGMVMRGPVALPLTW